MCPAVSSIINGPRSDWPKWAAKPFTPKILWRVELVTIRAWWMLLGTSFHQQLSSKGSNVFLRYLGTVYRNNVRGILQLKGTVIVFYYFFLLWRCDPTRVMVSSSLRFLGHTQRRATAGRTPLDELSARRRDLYLTTHDTHNRQTSMPPVGFEPTISAGERLQTYALDRPATGTGTFLLLKIFVLI